jgi:hypothetical protein
MKLTVPTSRLDPVLLTEGSTMRDPEIASLITINYWGKESSERCGNSFTSNHQGEGLWQPVMCAADTQCSGHEAECKSLSPLKTET